MDYISREKWEELSKWIDISQAFREAYIRFRLEGTEVHWLKFNGRYIEVGFSYDGEADSNGIMYVKVKVYCPDVEIEFGEYFHATSDDSYCNNEKRITQEIIAIIYRLAWSSFKPKVFKITAVDSKEVLRLIGKILIEKKHQCADGSLESACLFGESSAKCIIELYGKHILLDVSEDVREDWFDIILECTDNDRRWGFRDNNDPQTFQEIVEKVLYLALEPEVFQITTTDSEWEYELIRANVASLNLLGKENAKEYILVFHGRQIKIQFQPVEGREFVAHLDCVTTGRSGSCTIDPFDVNPQELIWKIQELAWEDMEV